MNRKNIPLLLMLIAGAVTWITTTYVREESLNSRLVILFAVMLVFYLLGSVLTGTLGYFERQNEKRLMEEGEVIEKDPENPEEPETGKESARE